MNVQSHDRSIVNVCNITRVESVALREVERVEDDRGASMEGEANLSGAGGRECDA